MAIVVGVAYVGVGTLFDEGAEGNGVDCCGTATTYAEQGSVLLGGRVVEGSLGCGALGGGDCHLIDAIEVVAALVVLEADGMRIIAPFEAREVILIGYQVVAGDDGPASSYFDDVRSFLSELVARLGIFLLVENGLKLVGR